MTVKTSLRLPQLPAIMLLKQTPKENLYKRPTLLIPTYCTIPQDDLKHSEKLPHPLTISNVMTSPAEVNGHRRVKLNDTIINSKTKDRLGKLCDEYMDIFSKHSTDKPDLVQISLLPKINIKPLDQKPYALLLTHHALFGKN